MTKELIGLEKKIKSGERTLQEPAPLEYLQYEI